MNSLPCWVARHEAEGHDDYADWIAAATDEQITAILSDARLRGNREDDEEAAVFDYATALCTLDQGHLGAHEFTPQRAITLEFAP